MAGWTAPKTWNSGDVLTAADMDTYVRDNTTFLSSTTGATVATSQATSSTSYTDLATVGPTVTITTGLHALVILTAQANNSTNQPLMSFAVSGATTLAAADATAILWGANSLAELQSAIFYVTLTAGSNTFTAKYRSSGASSSSFQSRTVAVIPLP